MRKLVLIMMVLFVGSVFAPRAQAGDQFSISVTPKLWASVENFNDYNTSYFTTLNRNTGVVTSYVQARQQINIPLVGVAIVMTPGTVPLDFLFNFYGGNGKGRFVSNSNNVKEGAGAGTTVLGNYEAKRTDVETLIRYRPEGKTVNFFTGLRVNSFIDDLKLETAGYTWTATRSTSRRKKTTIVLWEVGAGFFAPITDSGMHRFFGNTTFGMGSYRSNITNATDQTAYLIKGGAVAWDINSGYEFAYGQHFAFNMRYRAYVKPAGPLKDGYNLTVVHGPDFGITLRY
ncbi:MAG: hypothetical protein ABIJ96_07950 [Elusimicrobiota bacterium]